MDQGILEVPNYADEAEVEFHPSIHPSETHPGPWVFTLWQIKTLHQDVSQESFWYPRHETFITSAKLIEKFHDCTQIKTGGEYTVSIPLGSSGEVGGT